MENTWHSEITIEKLEEERNYINSYIIVHPNSILITRYYDEFKTTYVYNTNAIEGSPVTEYDTAYIIKSNAFLEEYSAKENMEILGSSKAWDYIITIPDFNIKTVQTIHKNLLFFDVEHAGIYRTIPVHIGSKQMLEPENIEQSMANFLEASKNVKNNLFEIISEMHLKFENIHPFIDGNGRTGRMIINLQLMLNGYLPINIKQLDSGKYYRCFRQYDKERKKGIQELYNLITKYEYEELLKFRSLIEQDIVNYRR